MRRWVAGFKRRLTPLVDEIYDDFDFDAAQDDSETPPEELWDDADWE